MKPQVEIEFVTSAAKEKKRIAGILAIPRISRNGNLYLPEELEKAHGRTVPVLWNHEGSPKSAGDPVRQSDVIGTMNLFWDPELMQLKYEAEVDRDLPETPLHTSLGAFFDHEDHVCGSTRCYSVPRGLRFVEASLTPTPGIPETTVKILENFACRQCRLSSLTNETSNRGIMSSSNNDSGGQDTSCITGKQFQDGIKSLVDAMAERFASMLQQQQQPPQAEEAVARAPSSMVDDSVNARTRQEESYNRVVEFFQRVKENPKDVSFPAVSWNVDKQPYLERWGYRVSSGASKSKTEGVTVTSGDMGQVFAKQVLVVPGGRIKTPVRQYCNFAEVPVGNDRAHFYTIGAFDFGVITEGTEPTNVSQTVLKKTALPAIRGAVQRIGYSQIENAPFGLVNAINEAMVLASIDDEATDLLATTYDAISTPTNWVRGDTGAAVSGDDAAGMGIFKREGLLAAKRLIAQQGYEVSPGNLVLFMHPKSYQDLMLDSNLNNFYQYARPDITALGVLEQLYGVDIVIADQVKFVDNAANPDVYRNVLAVKGVAFGMASARDVTLEAQRRNEVQQVVLSGTHRVKSVVIEETSSCRISSAS